MRTAQYLTHAKAIAAADKAGIRQRWLMGQRLLHDPEMSSPGSDTLRSGAAARLSALWQSRGLVLSEREIRRWLQFARAYTTESQLGQALADFGTWSDLALAGFPPYEPEPDEPPVDWRTQPEKDHEAARRLLDLVGEQGTLFPLDTFEPTESTLKDLIDYRDQQKQITARLAERDRKRDEYLDALIDAVDDDVSKTWAEAHLAAFGEDVE